MRKLVVISHISLDGVLQSMGGPSEDPSGGFTLGGWVAGYGDEVLADAVRHEMELPFDLLLGRTTFEIWARHWPDHADEWPGVMAATKYVASRTLTTHEWQPVTFLSGDVAEAVRLLAKEPGPDLHVYGSGELVQTLLSHDLVDELRLKTYPVTLGSGKQLFSGGAIPAAFTLSDARITSAGVILANYRRDGELVVGEI
ncbi:MAG: dihydrofolate reductase family protein [Candidatus Nanopelagicales bacterium]